MSYVLVIVLSCLCIGGFITACIGLEGRGHPIYLAGGWVISVAAGAALVWWWI